MSLLEYWPSKEHINQCIRTEAEELAEHTLLAVHEPMHLQRRGESETTACMDKDLLSEFLTIERPIPIIGRSGVGKSHIIRWLHAKLRVHEKAKEWHIVRIPKNASLRQVLELLLDGLEGETFEDVRKSAKNVGKTLNTKAVAEILLKFMGQQLRTELENAYATREHHLQNGKAISEKEKQQLKIIVSHCRDEGLPALINDPYFQTFLLNEAHCIFKFAKRLTSGASDEELSENDYQIIAKDLDFDYNISDLSKPAKKYVQSQQLLTSLEKRQEAATMLNMVLGDASRSAFLTLFRFPTGNFQELFKQIRKELHTKGETLVVLVEDMAAISAIEDVLMDSLVEESVYDGKETMCSLRSAIAVTDGYPGYLRRRDTIKTRATAEWWIEEVYDQETTQAIEGRIIDFCSRYINAARHGRQSLKINWKDTEAPPPIWHNEEIDRQHLDAFGKAGSTNISLYPLSPLAIRALVNRFCRDDQGQIRFNPRQIINQILLKILRECRIEAEHGNFPYAGLADIQAPVALNQELKMLGLNDPQRCQSLAAIWGDKPGDIEILQQRLSADIASEFGLEDFATHLKTGVVSKTSSKSKPKKPVKPSKPEPDTASATEPKDEKNLSELAEVDQWCAREKDLPQNEARMLRSALNEIYETYASKTWAGMMKLPSLKSHTRVQIILPFAMGNNAGSLVSFCSDSEFTDPNKSIFFHDTASALIRYKHYNQGRGTDRGWEYTKGDEDFLRYQNFAAHWVPTVIETLREHERQKVEELMGKHVETARYLAIFKENDTHRERLNKLMQSTEQVQNSLTPAVCQTLTDLRTEQIDTWEKRKKQWIGLLAGNDHAIEGDLAITAIKKAINASIPNKVGQMIKKVLDELKQDNFDRLAALLSDCDEVEQYNLVIQRLETIVRELRKQAKYPSMDVISSQTLLSNIKKLAETGNFEQIKKIVRIYTSEDAGTQWQIINDLDGDKVKLAAKTINQWETVFEKALPDLKTENMQFGSDRLIEAKASIDELLTSLDQNLVCVQGDVNDNA